MKNYTSGKNAVAIVIHQMFIIVMMSGIYASGYCIRNNKMDEGGCGLVKVDFHTIKT